MHHPIYVERRTTLLQLNLVISVRNDVGNRAYTE